MEKGGLAAAPNEAGLRRNERGWHCDEMRFGLWGQVRRRWGRKGVKIIQKVQIEFAWQYLVLAVDVIRCEVTLGLDHTHEPSPIDPHFSGLVTGCRDLGWRIRAS